MAAEILGRSSCPVLTSSSEAQLRGVSLSFGVGVRGELLPASRTQFLPPSLREEGALPGNTAFLSFSSSNISLWTNFGNKIYHRKFSMLKSIGCDFSAQTQQLPHVLRDPG